MTTAYEKLASAKKLIDAHLQVYPNAGLAVRNRRARAGSLRAKRCWKIKPEDKTPSPVDHLQESGYPRRTAQRYHRIIDGLHHHFSRFKNITVSMDQIESFVEMRLSALDDFENALMRIRNNESTAKSELENWQASRKAISDKFLENYGPEAFEVLNPIIFDLSGLKFDNAEEINSLVELKKTDPAKYGGFVSGHLQRVNKGSKKSTCRYDQIEWFHKRAYSEEQLHEQTLRSRELATGYREKPASAAEALERAKVRPSSNLSESVPLEIESIEQLGGIEALAAKLNEKERREEAARQLREGYDVIYICFDENLGTLNQGETDVSQLLRANTLVFIEYAADFIGAASELASRIKVKRHHHFTVATGNHQTFVGLMVGTLSGEVPVWEKIDYEFSDAGEFIESIRDPQVLANHYLKAKPGIKIKVINSGIKFSV